MLGSILSLSRVALVILARLLLSSLKISNKPWPGYAVEFGLGLKHALPRAVEW